MRALFNFCILCAFLLGSVHAFAQNASIPDTGLREAIRLALGLRPGEAIPQSELDLLARLDASNRNITNLSGLETATRLTFLDLGKNQITNIGLLAPLTELRELYLDNNRIIDITPVQDMRLLEILDLTKNDIVDVSILVELVDNIIDTDLLELYLGDNDIEFVTAIGNIATLQVLDLHRNKIERVTSLANLTSLVSLDLSGNPLKDTTPISSLTGLRELRLDDDNVRSLAILDPLNSLESLSLEGNSVTTLTPLSDIVTMTDLDLSSNFVSDLTPLGGLTKIVNLDLANNNIVSISPLKFLVAMETLNLASNAVEIIYPITHLENLTSVDLRNNQIKSLQQFVDSADFGNGVILYIAGNPLTNPNVEAQIQVLEGRGATINREALVTSPDTIDPTNFLVAGSVLGILGLGLANAFGASPCFIATAAYDTPMADDLNTLRVARDEYLLTNPFGTAFVDFYYRLSPPLADYVARSPLIAAITRVCLVPLIVLAGFLLHFGTGAVVSILAVVVAYLAIRRRSRHGMAWEGRRKADRSRDHGPSDRSIIIKTDVN